MSTIPNKVFAEPISPVVSKNIKNTIPYLNDYDCETAGKTLTFLIIY